MYDDCTQWRESIMALPFKQARVLSLLLGAIVLAVGLVAPAESQMAAQGFLIPQTQAVEYRGTIAAMNPQSRIVTIETDRGSVFALTHPTRRTSDRQVIGGIPPVQVRVTAYESPRALRQGMFIQFLAKMDARNDVLEPVGEIRILGRLPGNGFQVAPRGIDDPLEIERPPEIGAQDPADDDDPQKELIFNELRERLPPEMRDRLDAAGNDRFIDRLRGDEGEPVGAGNAGPPNQDDGDDGGDPQDNDEDGDDEVGEDDDGNLDEEDVDLASQWMIVSGQVSSQTRNNVSVLVPRDGRRVRVRFELSEDALVVLETDDLSVAAVGDPIHAVGEAVEPPRFFATQLMVTHVSEDLNEEALARIDADGGLLAPAGEDGGGGEMIGDPRGAAPVDPFDLVKREREERNNGGDDAEDPDEGGGAPKPRAGGVFHGRVIRIN